MSLHNIRKPPCELNLLKISLRENNGTKNYNLKHEANEILNEL